MWKVKALLKVLFTQPLGLTWCSCACLFLGMLLGREVMAAVIIWAGFFGLAACLVWVWQLLLPPSARRDDGAAG